jgi:hypothetical protein
MHLYLIALGHYVNVSQVMIILIHVYCQLTLRIEGGMNGKNALPDLVKQCAEDGEWKELDTDEEEWLLQQLRDSKATKTTKTATHAAADIEGTLSRLNPEVCVLLCAKSANLSICR